MDRLIHKGAQAIIDCDTVTWVLPLHHEVVTLCGITWLEYVHQGTHTYERQPNSTTCDKCIFLAMKEKED